MVWEPPGLGRAGGHESCLFLSVSCYWTPKSNTSVRVDPGTGQSPVQPIVLCSTWRHAAQPTAAAQVVVPCPP